MEVVPGETVSGAIQMNCQSVPTVRNIQTRAYCDYYAFYVPFRLLWPDFADFIAHDDQNSLTLPTVDEAWTWNFEPRLTQGTESMAATANNAFQRYCYHYVYAKFFAQRDEWDPSSPTESTTRQALLNRPSTFEVAETPQDITEETVDTSGSTLGVDDIREAFALDNFRKMREMYGERYVDYLRAIGVQANWSILEEPECIAKLHTDLPFRFVNATDTTSLGAAAGYFNGSSSLKFRKTFVPEHGLIAVYGGLKFDPIFVNTPCNPLLAKSDRSDFWSPEFEMTRVKQWPSTIFESGNVAYVVDDIRPKFEEHRKGLNENGYTDDLGTPPVNAFGFINTERALSYGATTDEFVEANLGGTYTHQWTTQWRLQRLSPVPRHGARPPLR